MKKEKNILKQHRQRYMAFVFRQILCSVSSIYLVSKKPTVYLNMTLFSRSRACVFHFYFTRRDKKKCLQLTKVLKFVMFLLVLCISTVFNLENHMNDSISSVESNLYPANQKHCCIMKK
jgi:hypothetical protein